MNAPDPGATPAALDPAARLLQCLGDEDAPWQSAFDVWPRTDALRWRVVLVRSARGACALLADHVPDALLRARVEARLRRGVRVVRCDSATLDELLNDAASGFRALAALDAGFDGGNAAAAVQELSLAGLAQQASPVLRLLDSTLYDALNDGASDVHFECTAGGLAIRCRIDGVMQPVREVDGVSVAEQIVSRLKVMAELDIGERRLPQDGRFQLRAQGRDIDFRVSVMPSAFGEDAVVRVLDRATLERRHGSLTLDALGLEPALRDSLRTLARRPHGMLLVTGPTGSGKTTTLYAALNEINTGRDKIITIEDPVEYQLRGIVQIPVNEKKGLSFARGLRSVLRHDPDRVMVGEIRDVETAQIAVQAALTGHFVFSSVHANQAFDVVGRFMHMGLDLYNVVTALNGVLAQRLMRVNCSHCVQPDPAGAGQAARLGLAGLDAAALRRGAGCRMCRDTGYRGRRAVAELLLLDDALRDLIAARVPLGRLKEAARERGLRTLHDAAAAMVGRGESTVEELERVAPPA